jgi:chromosome segregation ATPase
VLTDEGPGQEQGVEIVAQPPGKKLQSVSLLSGGEKALTAVSLIFAIFLIKPSPFCLLDEVDAPLDEANVGRYNDLLREMCSSRSSSITHNAHHGGGGHAHGVTMEEPGISKLVSRAFATPPRPTTTRPWRELISACGAGRPAPPGARPAPVLLPGAGLPFAVRSC